ncbi:hypothetical protein J3E69DRAFT_116411 [Trichoderma sp. SZMC 28015]
MSAVATAADLNDLPQDPSLYPVHAPTLPQAWTVTWFKGRKKMQSEHIRARADKQGPHCGPFMQGTSTAPDSLCPLSFAICWQFRLSDSLPKMPHFLLSRSFGRPSRRISIARKGASRLGTIAIAILSSPCPADGMACCWRPCPPPGLLLYASRVSCLDGN